MGCLQPVPVALLEPTADLGPAFLDFLAELRGAGESMAGTDDLTVETLPAYVGRLARMAAGIDLEPGRVAMSTYWLIEDGTMIGISRLRHELTPTLRAHGGHVGFIVRPSRRRQGYGTRLLAVTLEKGKARGMDRVLITCDSDNMGSWKIIEKNGGVLEDEGVSPESGKVIRRYWVEL